MSVSVARGLEPGARLVADGGWRGRPGRAEGGGSRPRRGRRGPKGEEGGQLALLLPALGSPGSPLLLQPTCWDVGGPEWALQRSALLATVPRPQPFWSQTASR